MKRCPKCDFQTDEAGMLAQVWKTSLPRKYHNFLIFQGGGDSPDEGTQLDSPGDEGKPKTVEIQNCESPSFLVFES